MYEFDENDLPYIRTRRALLVLDVQNDFLADKCLLPVQNPPGFLENVKNLTSHFRPAGYVLWIQTLFEKSRPINAQHVNSEKVITDAEVQRRPKAANYLAKKKVEDILRDRDVEAGTGSSETFLTVEVGQEGPFPLRSSPGVDLYRYGLRTAMEDARDIFVQKTHYSAFRDGTLVQSLRGKFVTEIYICGVLTNISVFATAMEAAKHGYAITLVEDCLGYRSKVRHDEALRQLVRMTGCEVISSNDLVKEFQAKTRDATEQAASSQRTNEQHSDVELQKAMSSLQLTESTINAPLSRASSSEEPIASARANGPELPSSNVLSQDVEDMNKRSYKSLDEAGSKQKPERVKSAIRSARHGSRSAAKETQVSARRSPSPSKSDLMKSIIPPESRTGRITMSREKSSGSKRRTSSAENRLSNNEDSVRDGIRSLNSPIEPKLAHDRSVILSEPFCEGDSIMLYDLIPDEDRDNIFETLRDEVCWQKMSHQGGDVPRLIGVQGEVEKDGCMPIYRHPADELPSLLDFTPTVSMIRNHVEARVGHDVNHVLIQLYRNGTDYISEHSDKTLDIVPGTFIANVSFGAERTMVFRMKKPLRGGNPATETDMGVGSSRQSCRIPLPHNSMCRVGLETNKKWLHGIRQDKRMAKEKTTAELAFQGARISLTFRKIGTFLDHPQHTMWGQGATSKSRDTAKPVINGETPESKQLLLAFGKENHTSDFDWSASYGQGFDVLHLTNKHKLYCSGDNIADLRVKFMLAEYNFDWVEGMLSSPFRWKDFDSKTNCISRSTGEFPPVTLIDNNHNTTVSGEYAILLYIDTLAGSKVSARTPSDLAFQYTRFQQATQLLQIWRAKPFSVQSLQREARLWVSYASNSKFIAGERISIADFSLFPVLLEIAKGWEDYNESFVALAKYFRLMRSQECVVKILGPYEPGEYRPR